MIRLRRSLSRLGSLSTIHHSIHLFCRLLLRYLSQTATTINSSRGDFCLDLTTSLNSLYSLSTTTSLSYSSHLKMIDGFVVAFKWSSINQTTTRQAEEVTGRGADRKGLTWLLMVVEDLHWIKCLVAQTFKINIFLSPIM